MPEAVALPLAGGVTIATVKVSPASASVTVGDPVTGVSSSVARARGAGPGGSFTAVTVTVAVPAMAVPWAFVARNVKPSVPLKSAAGV